MEEIIKALEIATTDKYKFKGIYATEQIDVNKIENFIKANYNTYYYNGDIYGGTDTYLEHGFLGVKSIYVYVKITKDDKIKVIIKSDKFLMM